MNTNLDYLVGTNKYGSYAVPKSSAHRPASQIVINGGIWEPDTIQYMIDNCGDGIIIHAGTFFGDFLPALAQTGNELYAFEPVTENYQHARDTLDINFDTHDHVHLFNYGLGEENTRRQIIHTDHHGTHLGGTSRYGFSVSETAPENMEETQVVTLDYMIMDHSNVSIIQLDVEGYEELALRGAKSIIEQSSPILILEKWRDSMYDTDFFKELFVTGYSIVGSVHDNDILRKV